MDLRDEIRNMVQVAVTEYLLDAADDGSAGGIVDVTEKTRLFGADGVLDSLGVVILLTDLEERLDDQFDASIALASDSAMSSARSPFRTVSSLTDYITSVLEAEQA